MDINLTRCLFYVYSYLIMDSCCVYYVASITHVSILVFCLPYRFWLILPSSMISYVNWQITAQHFYQRWHALFTIVLKRLNDLSGNLFFILNFKLYWLNHSSKAKASCALYFENVRINKIPDFLCKSICFWETSKIYKIVPYFAHDMDRTELYAIVLK